MHVNMSWSELYPKVTPTEHRKLRDACEKIDLIGQLIGGSKISAGPLMLTNLAEIYQVINGIVERCDRRMYEARRLRGKLTPEELAAEEARLNPPTEPPETPQGE